MKKFVTIFLTAVFSLFLWTYAFSERDLFVQTEFADSLPSIDSILPEYKTGHITGRIEVRDNLDEYDPFGEVMSDYDKDFRVLVLERKAPQKKFTKKTEYPPFTNKGLGEDFAGEDVGRSIVWLRLDLMELLPSWFRASSWEDATYLLIIENAYYWDTELKITHYEQSEDKVLPEFKNTDEMTQYFVSHPRRITSIDYYPTFGAYSLITYYDKDTKACAWFCYLNTHSMMFARNQEASICWNNMSKIEEILESLKAEREIDRDSVIGKIQTIDFIPQSKRDLWVSCIENDEISTAVYSISEYFWSMAEELKKLDPSEANQGKYAMIIEERNKDALSLFVSYCDYSGFDRTIESIEHSKDYIAEPDMDSMEKEVIKTIDYVFGGK